MKKQVMVFAVIIFMLYVAGIAYAAESFDFSCDTPVTVTEQFDGEIKYNCIVKNTGDSFLQLFYEAQPEQNPINPSLAVGFHPQPPNIFLEPGESQPIVGFEVPPRVPAGKNEISFTRTIAVKPAMEFEGKVKAKQLTLTTIVKSQQLNEETRVFGKVLDAQTRQPIADAEVFFKYKRFEGKSRTRPSGDYSSSLPALTYLMIVQVRGYELFSEEITPQNGEELKKDISLNKAKEKGSYELVKEIKLDPGAWEGVWRAAVSSNGQYIALGVGGLRIKTDSFEGYFYIFDTSGKQLLKIKTADEVRGIDLSPDGSLIAVGLGSGQFGNSGKAFEKVLMFKSDGELVWKKFLNDIPFQEVRFSHDGKLVAVGDTEGYAYLLDAVDGREIWKKFTRGQVRAMKFYDDDSHILVGSGDDNVYLFDINGNNKWKTYVHSWPYGFIATTPGNEFSAAGGHVGYLHLLDKNGNDLWAYETDGGFRWAEIGPEASFVVGGTRSELVFLDSQGNVLWKGYDSVSGAMTKDKRYILSGNQRGELELRDTGGTILWEHRTQLLEPSMDMRFSYISDDATVIVGAAKTGETYFFSGGISKVPLEAETQKENVAQAPPGIYENERAPPREEMRPMVEETPQNNLLWIIIPMGIVILLVIILVYSVKKK